MNHRCLVCGYDQMPYSPEDYNICPCCGVEYGVDSAFEDYGDLRDEWLLAGGPWFSAIEPYVRPASWNAWDQLDLAGYAYNVPRPQVAVKNDYVSPVIPAAFRLVDALRKRAEWDEA